MSKSDTSGRGKSSEQLVVVLQGEQALWSKWLDYQIVDTHVERLQLDTQALQGHERWLSSVSERWPVSIRLVLDSSLDEVDRVKIDTLRAGWIGRLQRQRVRRQLAGEYPHATIHALPGYAMPDVFSLVHHIMPDSWERWLMNLQDQPICITHVATSSELLCQCARDGLILHQAAISPAGSGPGDARLICMPVGEEWRHLLVDAGKPLYMRMTPVTVNPRTATMHSELRQTLRHISEHLGGRELAPPVYVPVALKPASTDQLGETRLLAELCMGNRIGLQPLVSSDGDPTGESPGTLAHSASQSIDDEMSAEAGRPVSRLVRRGRHLAADHRWRLSSRRLIHRPVLQVSIARNQHLRRITRLRNATLLGALAAAITVVTATAHGIGVARERARLATESRQLNERIAGLARDASALHDHPDFVLRSIDRIEHHKGSMPMQPDQVLARVARAVDEFPSLVLDTLSWSVQDEGNPLDTVFVDAGQVSSRDRLWDESTDAKHLQLELSGSVIATLTLREQQQALESFVHYLRAMPGISTVRILESPVNATRSSETRIQEDAAYRLSLLLGTS